MTDGVAAVQASAFRARAAAGGAFDRLVLRDPGPAAAAPRGVPPGDARPRPSARRSAARRSRSSRSSSSPAACSAVVWAVGGQGQGRDLASLTAGQAALRTAQDNLAG